jgi:asparagine synthetase B (glutamine-hydrolysing)
VAGRFVTMTEEQIATGWIFGYEGAPHGRGHEVTGDPRQVLDNLLRPHLQAVKPCHVLFSGGRDSSVVLAAAAGLARREGLDPPVPVTRVFPSEPDADEASWQQRVVRKLGLREWIRIEVDDELDVLGPLAREGLRRHGVVHPPTSYAQAFTLERLRGCAVITGEGGDEVFGSQRITPLTALIRRERPPTRRLCRAAASALAPAPVRRLEARAAAGVLDRPWLRPPLRRRAQSLALDDAVCQPLSWAAGTRHLLRHRGLRVGLTNLAAVAGECGVELVHPFLEPAFVDALARWGGWLGPVGRTAALRMLFGDLLPDALLRRTSKARFNLAAVNRHSCAFVHRWNGSGVDTTVVDVDVLRAAWTTQLPVPASLPLLQQAWLATEGGRSGDQ